MESTAARVAAIDEVLANRPPVHRHIGASDVYDTYRDCYEFLAAHTRPGSRSLETGLGLSTELFALWGAQHSCIVPFQSEVDALREHCATVGISLQGVEFIVERSDLAMPRLVDAGHRIDVLFIDGAHSYPAPVIDWHYGRLMLKPGGVCVIDDDNLPHVHEYLSRFLLADPRWLLLGKTDRWIAFRKTAEVPDSEEWTSQPFVRHGVSLHTAARLVRETSPRDLVRKIPGARPAVRVLRRSQSD